jgi:glutamine amidotransferase
LILPGVGDFDETMVLLNKMDIKSTLDERVIEEKVPILGVCVGMQILGERSEEGKLPGFGWIKGEVKALDKNKLKAKPYLPHMGWNSVDIKSQNTLMANIDYHNGFYFLHSYYFECSDPKDILCTANYGIDFAAAINHGNVYGTQFHPEKSHSNGVQIFKNFANL